MAHTPALPIVLSTQVANNGTVNIAYPTGWVQADFTSANASATAYVVLNDNDRYEEADSEITVVYDTSYVTLTNKTGYTWPVGTKVHLALAYADPVGEFRQVGAVAALGGSLTGVTDGDLADVENIDIDTSDTYSDAAVNTAVNAAIAEINVNLKEIQTTLNAVIQALKSSGLMATS